MITLILTIIGGHCKYIVLTMVMGDIAMMMDDYDVMMTMKLIPWLASAREGGNGSDEREAPRPGRR